MKHRVSFPHVPSEVEQFSPFVHQLNRAGNDYGAAESGHTKETTTIFPGFYSDTLPDELATEKKTTLIKVAQ